MSSNYVDLPAEGGGGGGVSTLNGLSGALTLVAGSGVTIISGGSDITISTTLSGANTALSNLIATAINADLIFAAGFAGYLQSADDTASQNMNIKTGDASSGASGDLSLKTGDAIGDISGMVTVGSGSSDVGIAGSVNIFGGNGGDTGGSVVITAGAGTDDGINGLGGNVTITGGASVTDIVTGSVLLQTQNGVDSADSGNISFATGTSSGTRGSVIVDALNLNMSFKKIINLANGTASTDAVNLSQLGSLTGRTITGTTNRIVVTNGDGVAGDPTIDIGTSVVTLTGTQELTNKTLTAAVGKGTWTASGTWILPAMTFGGNVQLAENISILLDAALSADGKWSGISDIGVLGETVAFGSPVYLKTADSRWYKTNAGAEATAGNVKIGICVVAGNAADPTTILLYGKVRADSLYPTLVIGAPVYLSTTAGNIQTVQPSSTDQVIRIIGYGNTGDELDFRPSNDYMTHT